MSIQVECLGCGKRYLAPEQWAGKQAKCPQCGATVEIPIPVEDVEPADPAPTAVPVLDLPGDQLSAGPAVADLVSDPFAAMSDPASPFGAGGVALPRRKAPRRTGQASGGGLAAMLLSRKLSLAVAAASCLAFLVIAALEAPLAGLVVAAIGLSIAAMGLNARTADFGVAARPEPVRMAKYFGAVFTTAGLMTGAAVWLGRDFRHTNIKIGFILCMFFFGVAGPTVGFWGKALFQRFGLFRVAACSYLGAFAVFMVVGLSGVFGLVAASRPLTCLENPQELFALDSVPLPGFPDRGSPRNLQPGVDVVDVELKVSRGKPGHYNRLRIYTPSGSHAPGSLPCVLIAPAGTNLLSGSHLGTDPDHPERVPYVEAGFAVVAFELDGEYSTEEPSDAEVVAKYRQFAAAHAGLVNARNALEYVLAKMPEVDPDRIYAVGHSSAAALAVLFAEHEPRIRACAAFAPVTDLDKSFGQEAEMLSQILPNGESFLVKASPITHAASLKCPLFLFHTDHDSVVPASQSYGLSNKLRDLGADVTLVTPPFGDHYDAMIEEGIPRAIRWLQELGGPSGVASAGGETTPAPRRPEPEQTPRPEPDETAGPPDSPETPLPPDMPGRFRPPGMRSLPHRPGMPPGSRPSAPTNPFETARPDSPATVPSRPSGATPGGEGGLDQLLQTIRSSPGDWVRCLPALNALAGMQPVEARRAEVAAVIEPLITDPNPAIQRTAIQALGTWGTKQSVPALAKLLTGPDLGVRWTAMDALGKLKSAEAVDLLAERVPDRQDGMHAVRALTQMGPVAEDAVIKLLGHGDFLVRMKACNVLEQIGGPKSVEALEKLMEVETHPAPKGAATRVLDKLRSKS
ncbi:MAG TPA: HEAT repeat domain-containing protein [Thermoguttaceae bacterium]|nr:HEAT repeat domain-containing protein [Thermoguttaceae bacterium]